MCLASTSTLYTVAHPLSCGHPVTHTTSRTRRSPRGWSRIFLFRDHTPPWPGRPHSKTAQVEGYKIRIVRFRDSQDALTPRPNTFEVLLSIYLTGGTPKSLQILYA